MWCLSMTAASLRASSGVILPSVQISRVSLSKSVIWPTRVASTEYLTSSMGLKSESIAITPMGWSSYLFSSAGLQPRPHEISTSAINLRLESSVHMTCSGLTICMSASGCMSAAVTAPCLSTSIIRRLLSRNALLILIFFKFSTMSVTSSTTPSMLWNSWSTPSMRIELIAAPSMELSSTRRSALPIVWPKPVSKGSATYFA